MKKKKVLSVLGIIFSGIALVISVVEIYICVDKNLNILLMPILLMFIMLAVLTANIVNLKRIINFNKRTKMKPSDPGE